MNVYDSERMVEALGRSGYVETKTPDHIAVQDLNYNKLKSVLIDKGQILE